MVLKGRGVLGVVVIGGELIQSAAAARVREVIPSCEEGVWRMLVRACLRRPCRLVDVNILGCYRVAKPPWSVSIYGYGLAVEGARGRNSGSMVALR